MTQNRDLRDRRAKKPYADEIPPSHSFFSSLWLAPEMGPFKSTWQFKLITRGISYNINKRNYTNDRPFFIVERIGWTIYIYFSLVRISGSIGDSFCGLGFSSSSSVCHTYRYVIYHFGLNTHDIKVAELNPNRKYSRSSHF